MFVFLGIGIFAIILQFGLISLMKRRKLQHVGKLLLVDSNELQHKILSFRKGDNPRTSRFMLLL